MKRWEWTDQGRQLNLQNTELKDCNGNIKNGVTVLTWGSLGKS